VSYNKRRLHKAGFFRELLTTNPDIDFESSGFFRVSNCFRTPLQPGPSHSLRPLRPLL